MVPPRETWTVPSSSMMAGWSDLEEEVWASNEGTPKHVSSNARNAALKPTRGFGLPSVLPRQQSLSSRNDAGINPILLIEWTGLKTLVP
jgi:hypothetical protein